MQIEVPDEIANDLQTAIKRRAIELGTVPKPRIRPRTNIFAGPAETAQPIHLPPTPQPAIDFPDDMQILQWGEAFAGQLAEAFRDLAEGLRPNAMVGLISATQPVLTVASSALTSVSLPNDAQVVGVVSAGGDTTFTWSAFSIDSFPIIRSGQVPNDVFASSLHQFLSAVPFANRVFESQVNIDGTVVNQSGSSAYHHGLGILYIDSRCAPTESKIQPRERFTLVSRVRERIGRLMGSPIALAQKMRLF